MYGGVLVCSDEFAMNQGPAVIEVVVGIVRDPTTGKMLITKRPDSAHLGGLWEFPGGKRETGESETATLLRELAEEVGIEVVSPRLFHREQFRYPDREVRLAFYIADLKPGSQAVRRDVADFHWVETRDLDRYSFPPANAALLAKLKAV